MYESVQRYYNPGVEASRGRLGSYRRVGDDQSHHHGTHHTTTQHTLSTDSSHSTLRSHRHSPIHCAANAIANPEIGNNLIRIYKQMPLSYRAVAITVTYALVPGWPECMNARAAEVRESMQRLPSARMWPATTASSQPSCCIPSRHLVSRCHPFQHHRRHC